MRLSTGVKPGNRLDRLLAIAAALAVWQLLAFAYPPYIVPGVPSVLAQLGGILADGAAWRTIAVTAGRLLAGLGLGVAAGAAAGALFGWSARLRDACRPLLGLLQSIPAVSWLVLALVWFGFDGAASVFIVAVSTLPVIAIGIVEGLGSVDRLLLDMGRVYRFGRIKTIRRIILPSLKPHFRAAARIAVGLGGKAVVMGEVMSTASGIGGAITDARLNIEPEGIIAWTLVVVALYYLLDRAAALLLADRTRPC